MIYSNQLIYMLTSNGRNGRKSLTHCGMRVFVDGEPGWFQVRLKKWKESGVAMPAYDHFFTDGSLIGTENCAVPTSGIEWKHNLPPGLITGS